MKRMMKKILLSTFLFLSLFTNAQSYSYLYAGNASEGNGAVTFNIYVFCDSKKEISLAAYLSGIRCVLFEGIPGTKFDKPLLSEGEVTLMDKNPTYFDGLYNRRYVDFVKECLMISKYKKSEVKKATLFQITIKALDLRKDLEKNNIKKKLGI